MDVIQAPNVIPERTPHPWLFLAGSIEMGAAIDWQAQLVERLEKTTGTIFNPRRDDWDSSWVQLASDPQFYKQVAWELMCIHMADLVFFNFVGGTKSPGTMAKFGICSQKKPESTVLRVAKDFWRFGNLEIVAAQANPPIHIIHRFEDAVRYLETRLRIRAERGTVPTATGSVPAKTDAQSSRLTHHSDDPPDIVLTDSQRIKLIETGQMRWNAVTGQYEEIKGDDPRFPPHDVGRRYPESRNPDAVDPAKAS